MIFCIDTLLKGGLPRMYKPLADEIRPASLDDVVGQKHILGKDGMLRRIVESGQIPNMIFYGPSRCASRRASRSFVQPV